MGGADLLISVGATTAPFEREMNRVAKIARGVGADLDRAISATRVTTPRIDTSLFATQGEAAGRAFTAGLERQTAGAQPFTSLVSQARTAASAIGLAFGVREVLGAADAYTNAANRLALVAGSAEQAAAAQRALFTIAQDTRTAYAGTVDVFGRFAQATAALGVSQSRVLAVTEAVNQTLAISGTSAQSASAALVQLGQGLGAGVLRGEELNSVFEQTPRLARAIADGLGVSLAQLRELGAEGQLTSDRVFGALEGQAGRIADEFSRLAPTIGQSFTQLGNAATRFVGQTSQASGAGRVLAQSIGGAAANFDRLANAAAVAGTIMAARAFGPPTQAALVRTATGVASINAAMRATAGSAAVAAGATRALGGALALVGGPVGAAILAVSGFVSWLALQKTRTEEATAALEEYRARLADLPKLQLEVEGTALRSQLEREVQQVYALRDALAQVKPPPAYGQATGGGAGAVQSPYVKLSRDLAAAEAAVVATDAKLKAFNRTIQQVTAAEITPPTVPPVVVPVTVDARGADRAVTELAARTRAALESATQLRGPVDQIRLAIDRAAIEQRVVGLLAQQEDRYGAQAVALRGILRDLERAESVGSRIRPLVSAPIQRIDAAPTIPPALQARMQAMLDESAKRAEAAARAAHGLRLELGTVVTTGRGLLQVADGMGRIGDDARRALDGALGLVDGLEQVQSVMATLESGKGLSGLLGSAAGLGGLVGIIGGAAGLLAGLSGLGRNDPAVEAMRTALRSNERALERLRVSLEYSELTVGRSQQSTAAISDVMRQVLSAGQPGTGFFKAGQQVAGLDALLRGAGSSLGNLETIAESFGLTMRDAGGNVPIRALIDLQKALATARDAALRYATSFDSLQSRFSTRLDLYNITNPIDQWSKALDVAADLLPAGVVKMLETFNVSTTEGRAAANRYLRDLFERADAGTIDRAILEKFAGITDFAGFLQFLDAPLDSLASAAETAAAALAPLGDLNLPPGFKRAFLEGSAAAPTLPKMDTFWPSDMTVIPYTPPMPIPVVVTEKASGEKPVVYEDNRQITVVVDGRDRTPRELAREIHGHLVDLDNDVVRARGGQMSVPAY